MSPHDAAIAFVKKNNYRINFGDMSKDKAKNLLRNVVLTEKSWFIIKYNFSLSCIKDG